MSATYRDCLSQFTYWTSILPVSESSRLVLTEIGLEEVQPNSDTAATDCIAVFPGPHWIVQSHSSGNERQSIELEDLVRQYLEICSLAKKYEVLPEESLQVLKESKEDRLSLQQESATLFPRLELPPLEALLLHRLIIESPQILEVYENLTRASILGKGEVCVSYWKEIERLSSAYSVGTDLWTPQVESATKNPKHMPRGNMSLSDKQSISLEVDRMAAIIRLQRESMKKQDSLLKRALECLKQYKRLLSHTT